MLGSAPGVLACRDWPRAPFDTIVAINNAWAVRSDWDMSIFPEDFAPDRRPTDFSARQKLVQADAFVPAQNFYGGFVFAGGTMAFTAAYWALHALRPKVIGFLGCDMVYPKGENTHFYGAGTADPLREDPTLRDLGAKSARLAVLAAHQGCACVNLSDAPQSALVFARSTPAALARGLAMPAFDPQRVAALRATEAALGYDTPDGRYWNDAARFDPLALADIDRRWREIFDAAPNAG